MRRIHALDGLRGALAVVVVVNHVALLGWGSHRLELAGHASVWVFFFMSSLVLARAWDRRFVPFLARRFVRLMPVYAACYVAACCVDGVVWWPADLNPPAWSMRYEGAAMLAFPAIVLVASRVWSAVAAIASLVALGFSDASFWLFIPFVLGAASVRLEFASPALERAVPQWLGKVSYSLYMSHWIVLQTGYAFAGALGVVAAVPITLVVAWGVWWAVERPSIRLSRMVVARKAWV